LKFEDKLNKKTILYLTNLKFLLSLSSIRAKKALEESNKAHVKKCFGGFSETDMLLHWTKYAKRLGEKGLG
jgi:hypothetical protein